MKFICGIGHVGRKCKREFDSLAELMEHIANYRSLHVSSTERRREIEAMAKTAKENRL